MRHVNPYKRTKRIFTLGVLMVLLATGMVAFLRIYSAFRAQSQIYALDNVPARPVAIIFGAEIYPDGGLSAMLADRVKMGAELYQRGKIKALLMTGDNHVKTYSEPEAMRAYAIKLGVPADAIVLDYAGLRTYDSCYRARDIFKVDKAILVTQAFHLDRSLLICNSLGISSIGVAADAMRAEGYTLDSLMSSHLREFPSTTLAIINLLRGAKPTFLGEPLPIFSEVP